MGCLDPSSLLLLDAGPNSMSMNKRAGSGTQPKADMRADILAIGRRSANNRETALARRAASGDKRAAGYRARAKIIAGG
jgi:hypothetical protein